MDPDDVKLVGFGEKGNKYLKTLYRGMIFKGKNVMNVIDRIHI